MRTIKVWTFSLVLYVFGYCLLANGLDNQNVICPQDWIKLHRGCYLFKTEKKNWDDALKYCNSKQGSLIVIQSTTEKNAIAKHLKNEFKKSDKDWYSGFKKENGVWNTVDKEALKLDVVDLRFKHKNQATRRGYDCGLLHFDGSDLYYANLRCRQKRYFICEYHAITSRPSTTSTTLLMTAEPVTIPSKRTAVPAKATSTSLEEEVIDLSATLYPPSISTTLSDSDVPLVFTVSKDQSTEKEEDEPVTVRVSRSTSGKVITQLSTKGPDSGEDDEEVETPEITSRYKTGGKSSSPTDQAYWTKPQSTVSVVPVVDKDTDVREGEDEEKEEDAGSKTEDNNDNDKEKGRGNKGVGVGKGRKRTSTTSTTSTATTSAERTRKVPTTPPTPRPTRYDWEEALEEFEGCYIPGGRHSARAQVLAARSLYQDESDHCPAVKVSKFSFPMSGKGETVKVSCGRRSGVVTFTCGDEPVCWHGQPDVTGCASPRFKALLEKVKVEDKEDKENVTLILGVTPKVAEPPTVEESIDVTSELVEVTEVEDVEMEDIIVTSKVITAITKKSQKPKTKRSKKQITTIVHNVVQAGSNLMSKKKKAVWKKMSREDKVRSASTLMVAMETATVSMAEEIEEPTTITQTYDTVEMEIQVVDMKDLEEEKKEELVYDSSQSDSTFTIPVATLKGVSKGRLAKAVFMTHYSMADLLGSTKKDSGVDIQEKGLSKEHKETDETATSVDTTSDSAKEGNQPEVKEEEAAEEEEEEEEEEGPQLASYILSASLGVDAPLTKLAEPITFSMKHTVEIKVGYDVLCSFWNVSQSNGIGFWSQEGCRVRKTNRSHTTCECDHMTNFAILLDIHNFEVSTVHQSALRLVTIIGCIISCMSLLAALFTFQCFTSLQGERTSIHKNLAVCLLLAEILFVAGVDQAKHQVACSVIAVFLHFFFLAAFSWMFLEGLHIIIMLIQVFDASRSRLPYYYLVGYGVPVVVVGISCLAYFPGYGTERFCWLTTDRYFIWAFAGPVALILMVNAIFLTYALTTVCRHADYVFNPKDKTTGSGIRQWILGALALEVLLGLTWMFGYFLLSDAGLTLAYIFTILNSLQGLFIFVFHCLLNKKAQKEYRRVIRIPLSRSSSSAATQSTLTKRNNMNSRSHEMNHSNSHKPSFNRGTYQPTTNSNNNANGDINI